MPVARCLERAAETSTPEQRLCLAVVLAAIGDAYNARTRMMERREAIEFLASAKRLGYWTWPMGVDPEYVQRLIDEVHDYFAADGVAS